MALFGTNQVLNQVLDRTDPNNPALRTTGGGGGGGGSVAVSSLPAGSSAGASAQTADYDTGAGTANTVMQGIALPASGGPVAGGTSSNPLRTDPTGTTPQPIIHPSGSLAGATERTADYDTGGGTVNTTLMGLALPGAGGPVAGGTAVNPVRTDPTGSTTQPVASPDITGGNAGSATPGTSDTEIVAADPTRTELLLVNTGAVDCYVVHGMAATTGKFLLKAGAALPLSGGLAKRQWKGITSSGTATIHYITGTV